MKTVLLVEDNKLDRRLIMHLLNLEFADNIHIDEASDGVMAMEMMSNTSYDLVITDLVMPKLEGMELINKIKSNGSPIPIIAISGSNPYYLVVAKKLGVHGVFTKPLDRLKFIFSIKKVFDTPVKTESI